MCRITLPAIECFKFELGWLERWCDPWLRLCPFGHPIPFSWSRSRGPAQSAKPHSKSIFVSARFAPFDLWLPAYHLLFLPHFCLCTTFCFHIFHKTADLAQPLSPVSSICCPVVADAVIRTADAVITQWMRQWVGGDLQRGIK